MLSPFSASFLRFSFTLDVLINFSLFLPGVPSLATVRVKDPSPIRLIYSSDGYAVELIRLGKPNPLITLYPILSVLHSLALQPEDSMVQILSAV